MKVRDDFARDTFLAIFGAAVFGRIILMLDFSVASRPVSTLGLASLTLSSIGTSILFC